MDYLVIGASLVGGLLGITGGLFLIWKEKLARRFSIYFVAFASGTLLAAAFLDLIPEALEEGKVMPIMAAVLGGFLVFLILEKFLMFYHCHGHTCDVHKGPETSYVWPIIIGDTLHNFVDGIAIAISFSIDITLGFATVMAVFAHEIPQEIGDFGVLLHAGLNKIKVLVYNVVSSLATTVGAVLGLAFASFFEPINSFIVAFIAGTFLYVSASDLIPHLKKEWQWKSSLAHIFLMVLGIAIMGLVTFALQFYV